MAFSSMKGERKEFLEDKIEYEARNKNPPDELENRNEGA